MDTRRRIEDRDYYNGVHLVSAYSFLGAIPKRAVALILGNHRSCLIMQPVSTVIPAILGFECSVGEVLKQGPLGCKWPVWPCSLPFFIFALSVYRWWMLLQVIPCKSGKEP